MIPESGRCPGGGHGNPLQYSCLENTRDRGAWQDTVHGVTPDPGPHFTPIRISDITSGCQALWSPRAIRRATHASPGDPQPPLVLISSLHKTWAPPSAPSILAWRTPWTEELGGLQSTGSQIVRHNRSSLALAQASIKKKKNYMGPFSCFTL